MTERETVICDNHGEGMVATFVCQHIAAGTAAEMRSDEEVTADDPWPDAYCEACAAFRDSRGGEWDEASEQFADVTVLCNGCYEERRASIGA